MDARVKPAHDAGVWGGPVISLAPLLRAEGKSYSITAA